MPPLSPPLETESGTDNGGSVAGRAGSAADGSGVPGIRRIRFGHPGRCVPVFSRGGFRPIGLRGGRHEPAGDEVLPRLAHGPARPRSHGLALVADAADHLVRVDMLVSDLVPAVPVVRTAVIVPFLAVVLAPLAGDDSVGAVVMVRDLRLDATERQLMARALLLVEVVRVEDGLRLNRTGARDAGRPSLHALRDRRGQLREPATQDEVDHSGNQQRRR